ncbi:MAG: efflux RND transporter periplasmic adaptor subunit, partial [Planctomycetota bacterium]
AARSLEYQPATTVVGTVLALRSVQLRNELAGRVVESALVPGAIVDAGALLVAFDVSVEAAEVEAQRARAALADTVLERLKRAAESHGASALDVDRARAERDVAQAEVARLAAIVERKTIKAPFRARVGMADVHPGQYLDAGTELTTLQGIDDVVHVDFSVAQAVAAALVVGGRVEITPSGAAEPSAAEIVAIDARVDVRTRSAWVRAKLAAPALAPGSSVRVRVPIGAARDAVAIPVSALRRGPAGDHVFVIAQDASGQTRAHVRAVDSGTVIGDEVVAESGLADGERVAASGSFKLREGVLVQIAPPAAAQPAASGAAATSDAAAAR